MDPRQPASIPVVDYLAVLGQGLRGMRIGVMKEGFGTAGKRPEVELGGARDIGADAGGWRRDRGDRRSCA